MKHYNKILPNLDIVRGNAIVLHLYETLRCFIKIL
jgi:hypothetical protein